MNLFIALAPVHNLEESSTRPIPALTLALSALLLLAAGASSGAAEDSRRVVQASEILDAIERGEPVDYDGVIVEGDLDLSGRTLGPVHFKDAEFRGGVNFTGTNLTDDALFYFANFSNNANFYNADFSGYTNFRYAQFSGFACFDQVKFDNSVFFSEAQFRDNANFISTQFSIKASFFKSKFSQDSNFYNARFSGYTIFEQAHFSRDANFKEINFSKDVDFMEAYFGDDVDFENGLFNGFTRFIGSQFNNTANFKGTQFCKDATFKDVQFNGNTSFMNSRFKEDALFENTTFRGELSLTRARYNKLLIRWYNINGGLTYDDAAYLTLLKNFKDLGYLEDYDSCYYEYRKERRGHPWPAVGELDQYLIRKPIDLFLQVSYGYGTKPLNALYSSLLIIGLFGAFWRLIGLGRVEPFGEYSLADDARKSSILEVLAFSATVFLSGTRLFIEPPPIPKIRGRSRSLIRSAFIFERVLGALFSILFFLAISGTVVRQI